MANAWFESVAEAQRRAKKRLPKGVYGALVAGSERGLTAEDNLAAFAAHDFDVPWCFATRNRLGQWNAIGSHASSSFDHLDAPVITIAGKDVPMPYAANLEKLALPNVGEVIEAVKAVTYRS